MCKSYFTEQQFILLLCVSELPWKCHPELHPGVLHVQLNLLFDQYCKSYFMKNLYVSLTYYTYHTSNISVTILWAWVMY